ncbi:tetratricopeptide repeat protein [Sphingomonas sp. 35-24ZXX]|uniref:tetratricopeptide repeat protein n=1 Tax=Sphingomonas sp. 35-24ZXX TaxID=1545915 RepID=UPI000A49E36D|nr:tetratricopeptide repeat protein [Sphingomonas sp. 35-24ZXX]
MPSRIHRLFAVFGLSAILAMLPASLHAGSAPDPQRLHQARSNCHIAYDLLSEALEKNQPLSDTDIAWAKAHELAALAYSPCPPMHADLALRATNRVIATPDGLAVARSYIEHQKDAGAMMEVGLSMYSGQFSDLTKQQGLDMIKSSADGGDPMGMYFYGAELAGGSYGAPDVKGGVAWMERAAAAGHVDAMHRAAIYYYQGLGVQQSDKKAFTLFRQAAESGHIYATVMAFTMIEAGRGTKKDFDLAYRLGRNLAEQGEVYGAVIASSALLQSRDAPKHETEVLYWMDYAIANGDEKIRSIMTPLRPQVAAIYNRPAPVSAPRDFRPRPFKACPMKTTCVVNHYSGLKSCTTNKDYWNDCDG